MFAWQPWFGPRRMSVAAGGRLPGVVLEKPRGSSGFGYDPIILDENWEDFAELTLRRRMPSAIGDVPSAPSARS